MASVLLKGSLKIGPTRATAEDASCDISEVKIIRNVAVIDVPPVLCTGIGDRRKGMVTEEATLTFLPDVEDGTTWQTFWDSVDDQVQDPPGTLHYEATLKDPVAVPIGPTNPIFYFRALTVMSETGGTVGDLMSSQMTNPIIAGTLVKRDTPLADSAAPGVGSAPGTFTPATAGAAPLDAKELSYVTALPATAWTAGQNVEVDGDPYHWDGSGWVTGGAPALLMAMADDQESDDQESAEQEAEADGAEAEADD